jgi:hypothetical protein
VVVIVVVGAVALLSTVCPLWPHATIGAIATPAVSSQRRRSSPAMR